MIKPRIEIRGDDVVCLTPLYKLVMTKEIFIECYNRWIKEGGYWINIVDKGYHDFRTGDRLCYECSECKSQYTYKSNYCPNCGCRMVEPQETQESDHKFHTCKHYTSGECDGSCGSYICKRYSNWESEVSDADSN